jgi:hypothetical protein
MKRSITMALLVLGAGATWWVQGQSTEGAATVWEFATVEALQEVWIGNIKTNTANICYHNPNGCRWDTIRINVDRWGQINDALAAALARLGERGWEPVAVTQMSPENRPSVLMKRRRVSE